jgi:hypothetical protein
MFFEDADGLSLFREVLDSEVEGRGQWSVRTACNRGPRRGSAGSPAEQLGWGARPAGGGRLRAGTAEREKAKIIFQFSFAIFHLPFAER